MDFLLPFPIPKSDYSIGYNQRFVSLGSCFAEEIGMLLKLYRFDVLLNPHGILFNSISIATALDDYIKNRKYEAGDLIFENGLWHSLNHHGSFSNAEKESCLLKINQQISEANEYLKNACWLFITLGSSWVYVLNETHNVVANCHKIPQKNFTKKLLDAQQQAAKLQEQINQLRIFNPSLKIVFTVSPVKYLRDGLIENNLSKAQLLTAVHRLCNENEPCFYFPAFELVNDVLRDYRFYKEDMVHPNEQAIKFVWENFIEIYLRENDKKLFENVEALLKFAAHKPLQVERIEAHQLKQEEMKVKIEAELKSRIQNKKA